MKEDNLDEMFRIVQEIVVTFHHNKGEEIVEGASEEKKDD